MALYKEVVEAQHKELAEQNGLATQLGDKGASKEIDEQRHENINMDNVGDRARNFMESVDFPSFVKELLEAVFDANLKVAVTQMQEYQKLMKAATASISKFVNAIDNTTAFGYLAENHSDQFSLSLPDENGGGGGQPVLADKSGNAVDLDSNEIKAKIMDAKIAMAREQRALLRETILMGVSRLVVEKGTVKAKVVFDVKATDRADKSDRAAQETVNTTGTTHAGGLPWFYSGGSSDSTKKAQISVSSAKSTATTDLAAQITGEVEINFKSDYFKLNNFAQMYGPAQGQTPQGQKSTGG